MKNSIITRPEPSKAIRILAVVFLVGVIGFAIPFTRPLFLVITPLVILFASAAALFFHDGDRSLKFYAVSLFVLVAGFFVEAIGVNTGLIFGEYTYGTVLGPRVLATPLIIGLNWLLLVYTARAMVEYWDTSEIIKIIVSAVLVTAFDIVLEPVAIKLNFWNWSGVQVPLQNYFAWFVIALVFSGAFSIGKIKLHNELGGPIFFLLFLFFILLNVVILFF